MPGSGKTTLGKGLASNLNVNFVDLDAEIEKFEKKSIAQIFRHDGEVHFRILEARLLREWAGSAQDFVMATGGGAPCFHKGMEALNQYGLTVFLDCPVLTLIERVKKNKERPLLLISDEVQLREKLERLRAERLECYRQSQIILENPTANELLKSVQTKN